MAPKSKFLLKDSPPEVIAASGGTPKGRTYSSPHSQHPSGIRAEDLALGMKLASLAITDDRPGTLKKISKTNPWQEEALTIITGSREEAHKPLTEILKKLYDLDLDCHIDVSGFVKGRALDTQGYIAHNDKMIVLSYRCTTSALDWITNLSTTSSEWEPDVDIELGHAGWCSCMMGHNFCGSGGGAIAKPRVHTGFYNNFLYTCKHILQYIMPLLKEDQPPRKLYVVGHSLGAGIATLAAIYFLLECEWELLPQKLICVTAGAPRSCKQDFQDIIENRLKSLRHLDKAWFGRIVLNEDVVTKVPPPFLGYVHVGKMVYITEEGEILINPSHDNTVEEEEMQELIESKGAAVVVDDSDDEAEEQHPDSVERKRQEKYQKLLSAVPRSLKDHMPDFYLRPLINVFEREQNGASYTKL